MRPRRSATTRKLPSTAAVVMVITRLWSVHAAESLDSVELIHETVGRKSMVDHKVRVSRHARPLSATGAGGALSEDHSKWICT